MSTEASTAGSGPVPVGMPRLSDSMQQGTIERWLVADGTVVSRGQEILEVETDKAVMAYEAESDGVLQILAPAGATVTIGEPIATIGSAPPPPDPAAPTPSRVQPAAADSVAATRRPGVSPLLRRIAAEQGVDLHSVVGTGRDGRITREDVLRTAAPPLTAAAAAGGTPALPTATGGTAAVGTTPEPAPPRSVPPGAAVPTTAEPPSRPPADVRTDPPRALPGTRHPLTPSQRRVADRLGAASRSIPDFWASVVVDVTAALALREDLRALSSADRDPDDAEGPSTPTLNDFILRATSLALRDHPQLNAYFEDDHVVLVDPINLGMAVATDGGLVVPVLQDADRLPLRELAAQTRALAHNARRRRLDLASMERGTFTVSNLGAFGIRRFAPIINGPQAAILGIGAATPTCVPRDGRIEVRSLLEATLTCDHRIVYGTDAAAFLQTFAGRLERPVSLLD